MRKFFHTAWLVAVIVVGATSALASESLKVSRYTWPAKSGAAYYRGKLETPSGEISFRTKGTKLTLPRSLPLAITAIDSESRSLGMVEVTETPTDDIASPLDQELPKPKDEIEAYLETLDALLESEGAFRIKEGVDLGISKKQAEPYQWTGGVTLGIGSETVKASGSVADYSGQSYTGDTALFLRWEQIGGYRNSEESPWGFEIGTDFHIHKVRVVQENSADATSQNTTEKLYRARMRAVGLYKIPSVDDDGSGVTIELGVGAFRVPVLTVRDESTGRTQFSSAQPLGPRIGVSYDGILTPTQEYRAQLATIMIAKDKSQTGRQYALAGQWFYRLSDELHILGEADLTREEAVSSVTCSRAAACDETSSSIVQQVVFSVGATQRF